MLLGDLLLAWRMFWISSMRAESSEKGGDRDSDLRAGSEDCSTHAARHGCDSYEEQCRQAVTQPKNNVNLGIMVGVVPFNARQH